MGAYPLQATTTYSLTDPNAMFDKACGKNFCLTLNCKNPFEKPDPHSGLLRQGCGGNLRREIFIRHCVDSFMPWARALIHIDWGNSPSTNCKINVKLEARNVFRMSWVYIDRPLQSSGPTERSFQKSCSKRAWSFYSKHSRAKKRPSRYPLHRDTGTWFK